MKIYDELVGKRLENRDDSEIRVVLTAVTLETISEMMDLAKEKQLEVESTQISVSKAKKLGNYHLMMGQNPVTIFTFMIAQSGKQMENSKTMREAFQLVSLIRELLCTEK